MVHTEESKAKLRAKRIGNKNPFFGKTHTQDAKDKMAMYTREMNKYRQYDLSPLSIKIPTGPDLYYLAGIVDGEGSIRFVKNRPFIAVYNSNTELMNWIIKNVGGSINGSDKRGRVVCYVWKITASKDVYYLAVALLKILIVKHEEANSVIKFLEKKYGNRI